MDKSSFIKGFHQEDPYRMAKLHESLERAKDYDFPYVIEEFYTPQIWNAVGRMKDYTSIDILGDECMERRVFGVHCTDETPLKILEVQNLDSQLKLEHKDYLGAVLALGIQREKFGDIFVLEDRAYIILFEEFGLYVINYLSSVGRCSVETSLHSYESKISEVKPALQRFEAVVASLRADAIVAELARTSRSSAVELIQKGLVLVNYQECKDKSKEIKPLDTITIRRTGKFKVGQLLKETHKGNLRMEFYRFL